ncbi:aspartate/glutamate racemase family protein [Psychroflexus sp. MES1-P1E]|uniref:aspartate/glutamate racemase family protein n=1 Tax=Psychroflexus sp. MES1-P1E TaxID=2058320 RepID=UPI000C7B8E10|nr:aspartate/glutamate racemase family protein [Psychroflexus sp. MES1-P1E]PKG44119.1 aspartate racemase [Psychroflexus sp. MES1-P1E]
MKKIGLIGGISWTSTLDYYKFLNQGINLKLGGLNSAECIIYSLNFSDVQNKGWTNSFDLIFDACKSLVSSNVDAIVLCANTAHLFADEIQEKIDIPILHIATATAKEINRKKLRKIGLLGTKFTMEMGFYRDKLKKYDIETIIPTDEKDIEIIQNIVKNKLGKGIVTKDSKEKFINYANKLVERGAEGIVLGCTEIPMLIKQKDFNFPVFDTTKIHVESIIKFALEK